MKLQVVCPGCQIDLHYDASWNGKPGVCPACNHLVLAPMAMQGNAAIEHVAESPLVRDVEPLDDYAADLQREGKSLARQHWIDLRESFEVEFASKAEADERLERLQRDLPEASSAYVPSGRLPLSALGTMLLGVLVAA